MFYGGVLALAIGIAINAWSNDESVLDIVLSTVTVPALLLLVGGGIDFAASTGRAMRLVVDNGVLHVVKRRVRGGEETVAAIALRGADVNIDRRSGTMHTNTGLTRSTWWELSVTTPDGERLVRRLPGHGTATTERDLVELEHELRRRT